ncbi:MULTISPECIES: transglutaminase family protein [unclassified Arthrobacter]|uniref:transglutaminase family protein n=1 Tax=unclassified Arthrobacter TaxID=235627 RepID=UPI0014914485|nr:MULTISPECIES: transglutaminase family protein [unclassified Arthrobacter]MBE0010728.1 transglutaminase family protein [Arthrobacter sp. AET 35A]NOJ64649.1 transglutaminase family protein [Arthrobacter sp. 147(2020)]
MTRLLITHRTGYNYVRKVTLSYNEARMTPLTDPQQVVLESTLKVSPSSAAVSTYKDYWGTRVTAFDMQSAHESLEVTAVTTVEVSRMERIPTDDEVVTWEQLRSDDVANEYGDWLPQTALTEPDPEVSGKALELVEGRNPHQTVHAIFAWIKEEMSYVQGVTGVQTNAKDAWESRKGVCQDLAHLAIGAFRSVGIPARYISGYLHPRSSAAVGEKVAGQSHAWVEWWDGEWRGWDPTNKGPVSDFHVSVARGRDYKDVSPLKGILSGGGGSTLNVTVEITRVA